MAELLMKVLLLRDGKPNKRKRNIRPTVRGAVMNAADHKHGGGEGRAPVGLSEPRTAYEKAILKHVLIANVSMLLGLERGSYGTFIKKRSIC